MGCFCLLFLLASVLKLAVGAEWCYESQVTCANNCRGPNKWAEIAPDCGGTNQSPINIVTRRVIIKRLAPFKFHGYQNTFYSVVTNNGHTVKLNLSGSSLIDDGELGEPYKAMEIHFHWGKNSGPGSEHTIDGERYPMEMHVVHIKEKYNTLQEAAKDSSGIAVLGFLYKVSSSANNKYDPVIKALANVTRPGLWYTGKKQTKGNQTTLGPVSLDMLIPPYDTLTNYFRYKGSLTTPNCSESVIWTVFESIVLLSKQQLSTFSGLQFENGTSMADTFRPVQPLGGREVYYSGCNLKSFSTTLVVFSVLITVWSLSD